MARAPFQVLVIPYRILADAWPEYLVFKRADLDVWQWIAGGGEDGETPEQAARREAREEADIPDDAPITRLNSIASIPAIHFNDRHLWGADVNEIPEISFGIDVTNHEVSLSDEHSGCMWVDLETALSILEWESNKAAVRDLHFRISHKEDN